MSADNRIYLLQSREKIEVCTDPQMRCYYGVFAKSEWHWTEWGTLYRIRGQEEAEASVRSWTDLNKNCGRILEYRAVLEEERTNS